MENEPQSPAPREGPIPEEGINPIASLARHFFFGLGLGAFIGLFRIELDWVGSEVIAGNLGELVGFGIPFGLFFLVLGFFWLRTIKAVDRQIGRDEPPR